MASSRQKFPTSGVDRGIAGLSSRRLHKFSRLPKRDSIPDKVLCMSFRGLPIAETSDWTIRRSVDKAIEAASSVTNFSVLNCDMELKRSFV